MSHGRSEILKKKSCWIFFSELHNFFNNHMDSWWPGAWQPKKKGPKSLSRAASAFDWMTLPSRNSAERLDKYISSFGDPWPDLCPLTIIRARLHLQEKSMKTLGSRIPWCTGYQTVAYGKGSLVRLSEIPCVACCGLGDFSQSSVR